MENWPRVSPSLKKETDMCFCCGQNNPMGLKLRFQWDGKTARSEFRPGECYQSWSGIVHGGILMCLLDEAMTYAALFDGADCVTARVQARLKRSAPVGELLIITSSVTKKSRRLVETQATITLEDGTLIAESTSTQFVVSNKTDDADSRR